MRAKSFTQIRQYSVDFFDLFDLKLANAIACLNRRRRLDEERAACSRGVVDDPTDRALRFPAHGNHETTVANCHRHVGDALVGLELRHSALEKLDQLPLRTLELAANFLESGGSIVPNLGVFVNRALDRVLDALVDKERFDLAGQNGCNHWRWTLTTQRFTGYARAAEQGADNEEVRRCEGSTFDSQASQRCPRIGHSEEMPRLLSRQ